MIIKVKTLCFLFHSLMFEILEDIQNDIFGDYRSSMRLKPAIKLEIVSLWLF